MSSVKSWMVGLAAGAVACGSVAHAAPVLVVDQQSQEVQTPAAPEPGFSYVQTDASNSTLKVYTEGFLFCGNPGGGTDTPADLVVKHQDQSMTPPQSWVFAPARDMPKLAYTGGTLSLNSGQETSLVCLGSAGDGALGSGVREGIFDNGYDSSTETNYSHLVNWNAPEGFDWNTPDWSEVPVDPCSPNENQPAHVIEDVTCAAVTGVRPPVTVGGDPTRAGTLWTSNDGTNFTYLFRFDARFGEQEPNAIAQMEVPELSQAGNTINAGSQVALAIRDAFNGTYLSTQAGTGKYCILTELPATLNSASCTGAAVQGVLDGKPLDEARLPIYVGIPPIQPATKSFYVVITRPIAGAPPSAAAPIVAVSVLVEGAVVREGGDKFSGDNIAFGFQPNAAGFSWMRL